MKKLYLEFIRGAAATTVLIYHFLELHTLSSHSNHFYFGNWGTDAVIIFFVLSGVVINISQTNNPKQKTAFITNRLIRLYPQLIVGLLLGLLVLYITRSAIPSAGVIAGNFFMISAVKSYMVNIVPCIASNSPLWSLSYEIVFYLIFALAIGRFQKTAIKFWFLLSLISMPFYYLQVGSDVFKHFIAVISFSSIWLIGYYVYQYRNYFYADKYAALFSAGMLPLISRMHISAIYYDPAKYLLFALFAVPFFRYSLQLPRAGKRVTWYYLAIPYLLIVYTVFKQPYLTFGSFAVYSILPVLLMAFVFAASLLNIKNYVVHFINVAGRILGKYSFSIYVIHYPVLFFCATFFHNVFLNLAIGLSCIAIIAYSLETYLQPAALRYFKKIKATRLTLAGRNIQTLPGYKMKLALVKRIILPLIATLWWFATLPFDK